MKGEVSLPLLQGHLADGHGLPDLRRPQPPSQEPLPPLLQPVHRDSERSADRPPYQILHLHLGQAGTQLGNSAWELYDPLPFSSAPRPPSLPSSSRLQACVAHQISADTSWNMALAPTAVLTPMQRISAMPAPSRPSLPSQAMGSTFPAPSSWTLILHPSTRSEREPTAICSIPSFSSAEKRMPPTTTPVAITPSARKWLTA